VASLLLRQRAFDFPLKVLKEVGPGLGMLALNETAPIITMVEDAPHTISIEAYNLVDRA
jgi:hypothetical protein